ncbi:MAG: phage holin family protein [Solirubrobacterales bacterium]|nr:phage holin family protein [Solirubrobacterales bacterium]
MAGYDPNRPDAEKTIGELVFEVSERTSVLIREEIELAKTEVSEKLTTLARGGVVAVVAGVVAVFGLVMLLHGISLGLSALFGWGAWAGYLLVAVVLFAAAAGAGWFAYNSFEKTGPPIPTDAIDEAQKTKALLTSGDEQ